MPPIIRTGLDIFVSDPPSYLKGRRLGLVTHPAAVTSGLQDAISAMLAAGLDLAALFGPEHGLYGLAADGVAVDHSRDPRTGLPVFSLYGKTKEPTPEMLAGVDAVIFDMQDVGMRFYTFPSTLFYILRGAARTGKPVIVLDRPNPITGTIVEGPLIEPGFESFVGITPVALRYALTPGEIAGWLNDRLETRADLTVIKMEGWRREQWFDQTGLAWVPTSPGIPHFSSAVVYPGTCLVEGTNLSEGRGTTLPFEQIGAPWVDGWRLARQLNQQGLAGVVFRPTGFTPWTSKHAGQACGGVQLHVTDRQRFQPLRAGLHLLAACRDLFPQDFQFLPSSWEGRPAHLDLLMGSAALRTGLAQGAAPADLYAGWPALEAGYREAARPYWLYP
jgi:uncharacterized protein YbbC (DUF1343 family)